MICADTLSRRPDYDKGHYNNNNITILPAHLISPDKRPSASISALEESKTLSPSFLPLIQGQQQPVQHFVHNNVPGWKIKNRLITWFGRIWIPDINDLCIQIIRLNHDDLTAGHPGRYQTTKLIQRDYWWPSISRDVQCYVAGCATCQKSKILHNKPRGLLLPNTIPGDTWDIISADLIVDLPKSQNHNSIFVVVDCLSKMVCLVPTKKSITAEGLTRHYRDHIWKDFGLPRVVITNQASVFTSNFMEELNCLLGIQTNISTAYHLQTDGQTEQLNQEIEHYLRIFVNKCQNDWAEWLPCTEFAINNKVNSSTGYLPFYIVCGKHPTRPLQPPRTTTSNIPHATNFAKQLSNLRKETRSALNLAAHKMKSSYDKRHIEQTFQPGDQVLLNTSHIVSSQPSKRLDHLRYRPFTIIAPMGNCAYRLRLPISWHIHDVFHISKLTPFNKPSFDLQKLNNPNDPPPQSNITLPMPESILEHCSLRNGTLFLVKWENQPDENTSWQHESDLPDNNNVLLCYKHSIGIS